MSSLWGWGWAPFPSSGTSLLRRNGTCRLSQTYWVLTLTPPLLGCAMLGRSENLPVLSFLTFQMGREMVLPGVCIQEHRLGHSKCLRGPGWNDCHQSAGRAGLTRSKFSLNL